MESFEVLAKQYQHMIYKIIHSLHIFKDVDEFYQVGLIALWDASQLFDSSKGCFTSYVYKFIKGRILSELTKVTKHEEHYQYPKEEFWAMVENTMEKWPLEVELLLSYFEGLTDHQKKWVIYTFVEDLSVAEIAAREKVSISAVKQWRKGAKEKRINKPIGA